MDVYADTFVFKDLYIRHFDDVFVTKSRVQGNILG